MVLLMVSGDKISRRKIVFCRKKRRDSQGMVAGWQKKV
jgi:hypothetical protein